MCDTGKYICAAYSYGGTIFAKASLTVEGEQLSLQDPQEKRRGPLLNKSQRFSLNKHLPKSTILFLGQQPPVPQQDYFQLQ